MKMLIIKNWNKSFTITLKNGKQYRLREGQYNRYSEGIILCPYHFGKSITIQYNDMMTIEL